MNPEEIEQLKSQIDDLNALLSEVIEPDSDQSRRRERLVILLLKLQDGQLERRSFSRLEKWLLADPDSLEYYVDFMTLCALLRCHFYPDLAGKMLPALAHHS